MKKWKRVLLFLITFIVIVRLGFVFIAGRVDREYVVSTQYDLNNVTSVSCTDITQIFVCNSDRLYCLELALKNLSADKSGSIIIQIYNADELIYQSELTLGNVSEMEWNKIFVNATLSVGQEYKLVIKPSDTCSAAPGIIVVDKNFAANEIQTSMVNGRAIDGQIAINYGYLRNPGLIDKLSIGFLWILLWIVVFIVLYYFDWFVFNVKKIKNGLKSHIKLEVLIYILEIFGAFIILNCSGINFQAPTKVALYLISLFSVVDHALKRQYILQLSETTGKRVVLVLLYFYLAFALVGQRIFIYPIMSKVSIPGFLTFVCTIFWAVPVIDSMFYYFNSIRSRLFIPGKRLKQWQFIVLSFGTLLLPAIFNLIANNPGISSPDSLTCMITQAQNLHGSGDWQPAFYCMIIRLIENIWNSTYAIIIVQYMFWIYVCLELLLYLRKKGVCESALLCVSVFLGFNAGNYMHLNTLWKDIPYTLSVFWAFIILAKLLIDYDEYKKRWYIYFELIISLVGMSLYRKNGIVPFVMIIAFLIIVLRKNIKVWVSVLISVALFFVIKGPVYSYFEIQPVKSGMYIGLSQDILGVYYSDGEISEDTLKMINVMTSNRNSEYKNQYVPTWSLQSYELAVDIKTFIINYTYTFLKNPEIMIKAILNREDAVWDIFAGQDTVLSCVNYNETMDDNEVWSQYYEKRQHVGYSDISNEITSFTANSQLVSAIQWRSGLLTLLGIVVTVIMFWLKKKWKYILLLTPAVGHFLSLYLSTGWSDFRYFWPLNLMNVALILIVFVITKGEEIK